jgi:hypothetical protein
MATTREEVLRALKEEGYRHDTVREAVPKLVRKLDLKVEGDREAFAKEVAEEATKETRAVLNELWRNFGIFALPPEVEEAIGNGDLVEVWYPNYWKGLPERVAVETKESFYRDGALLLLPPNHPGSGGFAFEVKVWAGLVEAQVQKETVESHTSGLVVRGEGVYFKTKDPEEVARVLEGVRYLRPFLSARGLGGLEGALEELAGLEEGEVRAKGEYVVARKGGLWVLGRGPFLGDPLLDGALLLGERVRLRFPDDVELSFRGRFRGAVIALEEVEIRWGEGVVNFGTYRGFYAFINERDERRDERKSIGPIGRAIRRGLEYEPWTFPQWTFAQYIERGREAPWMVDLLWALGNSEDPLEILRSGEASGRAKLKALAGF